MLPTYIVRVFPAELKSLGSDTMPVQVRLPVLFYEGTLSSVCRWKGSFSFLTGRIPIIAFVLETLFL